MTHVRIFPSIETGSEAKADVKHESRWLLQPMPGKGIVTHTHTDTDTDTDTHTHTADFHSYLAVGLLTCSGNLRFDCLCVLGLHVELQSCLADPTDSTAPACVAAIP